MSALDWEALGQAKLQTDPYEHFRLANVLTPEAARAIAADFPPISGAGSYSLQDARPGPALRGLVDELQSDRFRDFIARVFDLDLAGKPVLVTLRGNCDANDGKIHTDSETKLITILLYLNEGWTGTEGQLRLLRNGTDLENYAAEVPPTMGSLVAFRRSDRSWHGHTRFEGQRRVLQINYLQSARNTLVSELRHRLSALVKRPVAAQG